MRADRQDGQSFLPALKKCCSAPEWICRAECLPRFWHIAQCLLAPFGRPFSQDADDGSQVVAAGLAQPLGQSDCHGRVIDEAQQLLQLLAWTKIGVNPLPRVEAGKKLDA